MITLYHGSDIEIKEIDLARSRINKDFGRGFYLSSDLDQARNFAKYKADNPESKTKTQVVTKFETDETTFTDGNLRIKRFDGYTLEWAQFIKVDGVSFIDKLSFDAFNEGTRLTDCLSLHKRLFGTEVRKVGGDAGYAGAGNRDYCKELDITTSFSKRGRPSFGKKVKDAVRQELARVRATAMEGSFGTQKEHYDLKRVKVRTEKTETLYIFFGIHTANVVQLADRIERRTARSTAV